MRYFFLLLFSPCLACGGTFTVNSGGSKTVNINNGGTGTVLFQLPSATIAFAVESSTAFAGLADSITTDSGTVTTSANTTLMVMLFGWRNSNSQIPSFAKWGSTLLTISTYNTTGSMATGVAYLLNPTKSSSQTMNLTMSANTQLVFSEINFTSVTQNPANPLNNVDNTASATVISDTITTTSGDIGIACANVQDPSLGQPTEQAGQTSAVVTSYSTTGNGGWFLTSYKSASGTTDNIKWSWSGGRRVASTGLDVKP